MQEQIYIVNTARASVVSKQALIESIDRGQTIGFATDVYWDEFGKSTLDIDLHQRKMQGKNIIMTPHLGGCTYQGMSATEEFVADELISRILLSNKNNGD
jgi:D-3-phosphoglycerate dehydrogenase